MGKNALMEDASQQAAFLARLTPQDSLRLLCQVLP